MVGVMRIRVAAPLLLLAALATPTGALADPPPVCALACDRLDPSQAKEETFPVPDQHPGGRLLRLHVSDADAMAWASVDSGQAGDQVWLDRSWDGGAGGAGRLGMASIPGTWTGTRTLMYNLGDPSHHRRGLLRACANAGAVACTSWVHADVCDTYCDRLAGSAAGGDVQPVPATTLSGRTIALHADSAGMAWATLAGGRAGDEVWLDRSWDGGGSWPDGSSLGRVSVAAGAAGVRTVLYNTRDPRGLLYGGVVRACGRAVEG